MESKLILLAILVVAILGKANSVAVAACLLLLAKLISIDQYIYPSIEQYGTFIGLVILISAILVPIAKGNISLLNIRDIFTSWIGVTALILSLLTTTLSGMGLDYLTVQGHTDVMPALILGAVVSAAFLGGVPVGPLITSGILALFAKIIIR